MEQEDNLQQGSAKPCKPNDTLQGGCASSQEGNKEISPTAHNKDLGKRGEKAAARYLGNMGYTVLERNWKCPAGEVDIIAKDLDCLVFVEVKTRIGYDNGLPEEAVDAKKRKKYESIALYYVHENCKTECPVRFDVISLNVVDTNRAFIRHHINAFGTR